MFEAVQLRLRPTHAQKRMLKHIMELCCGCNAYVHKDLSVRTHKCWYCGLEIGRDLNASINILKTAVSCTASDNVRKPQDISPRTIVFTNILI